MAVKNRNSQGVLCLIGSLILIVAGCSGGGGDGDDATFSTWKRAEVLGLWNST